jgi:hypothetical protein
MALIPSTGILPQLQMADPNRSALVQLQSLPSPSPSTDAQPWANWPVTLVTQTAGSIIQGLNSYFTTKKSLSAFSAAVNPDSDTIAIYNDGKLVLPAGDHGIPAGRNVVIYNGPQGEMLLAPAPPPAPTPTQPAGLLENEKEEKKKRRKRRRDSPAYSCPRCRIQFTSEKDVTEHRERRSEFCDVHKLCLKDWEEHNRRTEHRVCGVVGCRKKDVDFGHTERYLKHFRNKHAYARS